MLFPPILPDQIFALFCSPSGRFWPLISTSPLHSDPMLCVFRRVANLEPFSKLLHLFQWIEHKNECSYGDFFAKPTLRSPDVWFKRRRLRVSRFSLSEWRQNSRFRFLCTSVFIIFFQTISVYFQFPAFEVCFLLLLMFCYISVEVCLKSSSTARNEDVRLAVERYAAGNTYWTLIFDDFFREIRI